MSILHSPKQNQLLAALPTEEYARLLPYLELVDLPLGQVIYEPNTRISQLYFPTTCIMARMYERQDTHKRTVWFWTLIGTKPQLPWMRGTVNTVVEAKAATKVAIERFAAAS